MSQWNNIPLGRYSSGSVRFFYLSRCSFFHTSSLEHVRIVQRPPIWSPSTPAFLSRLSLLLPTLLATIQLLKYFFSPHSPLRRQFVSVPPMSSLSPHNNGPLVASTPSTNDSGSSSSSRYFHKYSPSLVVSFSLGSAPVIHFVPALLLFSSLNHKFLSFVLSFCDGRYLSVPNLSPPPFSFDLLPLF